MSKRSKGKSRKFLQFILDDHAEAAAIGVFVASCLGTAVLLSWLTGDMSIWYVFICAGSALLALFGFNHLVAKYRERKFDREIRQTETYREALEEVRKHGSDGLSEGKISLLVRRAKKHK